MNNQNHSTTSNHNANIDKNNAVTTLSVLSAVLLIGDVYFQWHLYDQMQRDLGQSFDMGEFVTFFFGNNFPLWTAGAIGTTILFYLLSDYIKTYLHNRS